MVLILLMVIINYNSIYTRFICVFIIRVVNPNYISLFCGLIYWFLTKDGAKFQGVTALAKKSAFFRRYRSSKMILMTLFLFNILCLNWIKFCRICF